MKKPADRLVSRHKTSDITMGVQSELDQIYHSATARPPPGMDCGPKFGHRRPVPFIRSMAFLHRITFKFPSQSAIWKGAIPRVLQVLIGDRKVAKYAVNSENDYAPAAAWKGY